MGIYLYDKSPQTTIPVSNISPNLQHESPVMESIAVEVIVFYLILKLAKEEY